MEQQNQPQQPPENNKPLPPEVLQTNKKSSNRWIFILIIVVIISSYFISAKMLNLWPFEKEFVIFTPSPTPTPDITANWNTYISPTGYQIKYPLGIRIDKSENEFGSDSFIREGVKPEDQIGMTIYYRNALDPNQGIDINRPLETVTINNHPALRVNDNPPYVEFIWIYSIDRQKVVRININTAGDKDAFKKSSFETFNKMLSTIEFIEPIDTSNWQTYRNEEFGFEVKYPSFYKQGSDIPFGSFLQGTNVATLSYQKTNLLHISVSSNSFENYRLIDNSGGYAFHFDVKSKQWLHQNNQTSEFVPKQINVPVEAYTYPSGDITCGWDWMVIPHPSYSFVVEILDVTCAEFDKTKLDYVLPDFNLEPEQILSTFKFI